MISIRRDAEIFDISRDWFRARWEVIGQPRLTIRATAPSELILVDVPMEFEPAGIWKDRI